MFAKTCVVTGSIAAFLSVAGTAGAQWIIEAPGGRQPVAVTKPRIAPLPEAQWTEVQRGLVAKFSRDGRADNGLKTLLHVPELVEGVMPYTIYLLEESTLSPRQREILVLRTAWLCGSQSLWATHAARAKSAGMEARDLRRIAQGSDAPGWDPIEATLLRMADQLYRNSSVTNATWKALTASFDMFHVMDAVETVNHFIVLSLVYNSFGVQPDEGLADRLPMDVPYRLVVPTREPPLTTARFEPNEGRGIAVSRTFARYPKLNERWGPRQNFINRTSKLSPRHREMLILRMGWNCRAEYEWAKHVGTVGRARDHGLDPARIAEGPKAPGWDPFESHLLRVADDLYGQGIVSDGTWRALTDQFDTGLVMSAVFTSSDYRAISLSLNTYGVQLEEGDEHFPQVPAR